MLAKRLVTTALLLGLGLYLLTRLTSNTIYYYINERFVVLTAIAVVGFWLIALGYWYQPAAEPHDHDHNAHEDHDHHHEHITWLGLVIVAVPLLLGFLVPPKPLGAAALSNREVNMNSMTSLSVPKNSIVPQAADKNIMDWLIAFQQDPDPAAFSDQEVSVVGFVYRDERFAADTFMVGRFIVSCCVADADPVGLIVRSADADQFPADQWLAISGQFAPGEFEGQAIPIIIATEITTTEPPPQPYLYP